ncbi:membrane protein, partial [Xanthomonas hyacinthi DSM 19077]
MPPDLGAALAADPAARATCDAITAPARRDWIFWSVSGKKADTRLKRIASACAMLASGKRRA